MVTTDLAVFGKTKLSIYIQFLLSLRASIQDNNWWTSKESDITLEITINDWWTLLKVPIFRKKILLEISSIFCCCWDCSQLLLKWIQYWPVFPSGPFAPLSEVQSQFSSGCPHSCLWSAPKSWGKAHFWIDSFLLINANFTVFWSKTIG